MVVYRLKDQETILGRSFCRHCQHQIRFYDNIPLLSFLILGGKCRDCGTKISWQYPILELLTGLCFSVVGVYFFDILDQNTWAETVWLLILSSLLLSIAAYDMVHMEIPLSLLVAGVVSTFIFLLVDAQGLDLSFGSRQTEALLGALSVGGFFFALVFISKETWMGWGDVWLGALAGMVVGLSSALFMMTLSFGLGAIIGIGLILSQKKGLKSQVPFAPYLVLGTLLAVFLPEIFPEYTQLFLL